MTMTTELVELAEENAAWNAAYEPYYEAALNLIGEHCPDGKWLTGPNTLAMAIGCEFATRARASRAGGSDGFVMVPRESAVRWLDALERAWYQIDNEWGPTDGGIESDIEAWLAPEIAEMRAMLSEPPAAPEPVGVGSNNLSNDEENV